MEQYKYYTMRYNTIYDVIDIPTVCIDERVFPATREGAMIRICDTYSAFHAYLCGRNYAVENVEIFEVLRRS